MTVIEVFSLKGKLAEFNEVFNTLPFYILMFLFMIHLGLGALRRFEGFSMEAELYHLGALFVLITLWPNIMDGIKYVVDVFNTILIRDVFHIPWNGYEAVVSSIWSEVAREASQGGGILETTIVRLCAVAIAVVQAILYMAFVIFFLFYKVLGPFILARGVFSEDFSVFKGLLRSVTLLFLWQTTFIFLLGVFHLSSKELF